MFVIIIDMILFQGKTGSGVAMWLDTRGRWLISVLGNSEKSVSSADFFCRTVHCTNTAVNQIAQMTPNSGEMSCRLTELVCHLSAELQKGGFPEDNPPLNELWPFTWNICVETNKGLRLKRWPCD